MMLPSFFFSPAEIAQQRKWELEAEQRRYEHLKSRGVIDWDPNMKIPTKSFVVRGESYNPGFKIFDVKAANPYALYREKTPKTCVEYKLWRYGHQILPAGRKLILPIKPDTDSHPEVFFTTDVTIPVLVEYTKSYDWEVWMSITPAELLSQRSGIKFCRGNVVIGGLGMGWFMQEVLKRKQVAKVTVVEKNRDLLDWYGERMCKEHGVDLICDDVWNVVGKQPAGTRYAIDIWKGFFRARYDRQLMDARKAGHDIWAWGSARGGESW